MSQQDCSYCKQPQSDEEKSFFSRTLGTVTYYACSDACENKIIEDILHKIREIQDKKKGATSHANQA